MDTIRTRLSILIALLIIGYLVWQLTRPNLPSDAKTSIKAAAPVSLLSTVESGLESGGLAVLELFQQGQELDAARTYQAYLSGDFTPKYKTDLAKQIPNEYIPVGETSNEARPVCIQCSQLVNASCVFSAVSPITTHADAYALNVISIDIDGKGLILLPAVPENAAKRVLKSQFKIVLALSGTTDKISIWHPDSDSYLAVDVEGRGVVVPAASVVGSMAARQAASFGLETKDGFTVCITVNTGTKRGVLGFPDADKRLAVLPLGYSGITRFSINDPVDDVPLLANYRDNMVCEKCSLNLDLNGENPSFLVSPKIWSNNKSVLQNEGFEVDSSEDSSREVRDKRWVTEQVKSGMLCEDELDIETFQTQDVPKVAKPSEYQPAKPSEMVLNAAVDKALDDVFQANTGKVFSDMMTMDKKDRESQLDNQVFQRLEKAKMDPGIKSILDYNEARYDIYRDENARYQTKIENQTVENTKRLDQMINDLDKYKIQKLAQEYYYLKMIRDDSKGRTLPKQVPSSK